MLVQYNKFEFNQAQYGPYPAKVGSDRVTDENAPVEVLVPDHPVFTTPNRIGPDAWAGLGAGARARTSSASAIRATSIWCGLTDPFEYNAGPKTGALVEARSARAAGSTSASGCGGSCRPAPTARIG